MPRITSEQLDLLDDTQRRKVAGRTAKAAGAAFERDLDATHRTYDRLGWAIVERQPVPTAPRGCAGGMMLRVAIGRSGVDYWGVVKARDGVFVPVLIEAKFTAKYLASLPIVFKTGSGLKAAQLEYLCYRWERYGIFPLVIWGMGGLVGWAGPDVLMQARAQQAKRISQDRFSWTGIDWYPHIVPLMQGVGPSS